MIVTTSVTKVKLVGQWLGFSPSVQVNLMFDSPVWPQAGRRGSLKYMWVGYMNVAAYKYSLSWVQNPTSQPGPPLSSQYILGPHFYALKKKIKKIYYKKKRLWNY